jgi:hypothetical protein
LIILTKKPNIKKVNLSFRGRLTPINKKRITKLVQHHMAHPSWNITDVHNYHKNGNGWAGIGYNWWIDFDGNIYEGRGWHVGAHCKGHNSTTLGVGYQGDFSKQKMTDAQLKAGKELNEWLLSELGLPKSAIVGHNDLVATTCPGKNFRMDELKGNVEPKEQPKPVQKKKPSGNANIRKFQEWLNKQYNAGLVVDGIHGPRTKKAAIKGLQTELNKQFSKGLKVDGIWGPKTRAACVTVRTGARGNITKLIQGMLYCKGYNPKYLDGIFGRATADSVLSFQRDHGLAQDAIVGKRTFEKLFA